MGKLKVELGSLTDAIEAKDLARCWLSLRTLLDTAEKLKDFLEQLPEVKTFKRFTGL